MREEQKTILERLRELDEASLSIRPPKEEKELLQEIVRLAVELVDGEAGWLYIYHSHRRELDADTIPIYELPGRESSVFAEGVKKRLLLRTEGLDVINSGEIQIFPKCSSCDPVLQSCQFECAIGVPLRILGEVAGVLFVGGRTLTKVDNKVEILKRFAN